MAAREIKGGHWNLITYLLSPMSFVLKNLPKQREPSERKNGGGYQEYQTIPPDNTRFDTHPQMKEIQEMKKQHPI